MEGLIAIAGMEESDIVVTAVVGMMGIRPTMEAIRQGKDIALANKETLVTAGHLIMPMAKEYGVKILPVDSEHSAVFQCLHGARRQDVDSILLVEDVWCHFRVPLTGEVSEVYACIKQFLEICSGHNVFFFNFSLFINLRVVALGQSRRFSAARQPPQWGKFHNRNCA